MVSRISKFHYITQDIPGFTHDELAEMACKAGADWIQLRMKNIPYERWLKTAVKTAAICKKYNAKLIINDNVDIALETDADGVHLGKNDVSTARAREILGKERIIGGTANTMEDVTRLSKMNVNYIGLGPFRFTSTKKNLSEILGMEGIKKIVSNINDQIPIIAIGGIRVTDVEEIITAGAFGIAVSSAVNLADSKEKAIMTFRKKLSFKNKDLNGWIKH